ncbi:MAG: Fe-S cluster assembly sulfur transfer protein SufU [Bacteroidota bacterium]
MNERLKQLYKTVILAHNKDPFHYEKKEAATHRVEAYNSLCGDKFQVFLEVEDDQIRQVHFHGYGCAISKAATSVLAMQLEGKTVQEATALCAQFQRLVTDDSAEMVDVPEDFEAFTAARDFPGRLTCATLSWEAVEEFLKKGATD